MINLLLLFTGFILGVGFTILGIKVYQDNEESKQEINETETRINNFKERLENEKRNYYNGLQAQTQTD